MHLPTLRAFVRCAANWQALQDRDLASAEWVGQLLGKERSGKCNTPAADAINAAVFGTSGSGLRVVQVDGSTDLRVVFELEDATSPRRLTAEMLVRREDIEDVTVSCYSIAGNRTFLKGSVPRPILDRLVPTKPRADSAALTTAISLPTLHSAVYAPTASEPPMSKQIRMAVLAPTTPDDGDVRLFFGVEDGVPEASCPRLALLAVLPLNGTPERTTAAWQKLRLANVHAKRVGAGASSGTHVTCSGLECMRHEPSPPPACTLPELASTWEAPGEAHQTPRAQPPTSPPILTDWNAFSNHPYVQEALLYFLFLRRFVAKALCVTQPHLAGRALLLRGRVVNHICCQLADIPKAAEAFAPLRENYVRSAAQRKEGVQAWLLPMPYGVVAGRVAVPVQTQGHFDTQRRLGVQTPPVTCILTSETKPAGKWNVRVPLGFKIVLQEGTPAFSISIDCCIAKVALKAAVEACSGKTGFASVAKRCATGVIVLQPANCRDGGMLTAHSLCFELANVKDSGPSRKRGRGE
jgi:hypothetical protein